MAIKSYLKKLKFRKKHAENITCEKENSRIQELEQKLEQMCKIAQQAEAMYQEEQQAHLSLIQNLISVSDKLLSQKKWMEEQAPEEKNAYKVVNGQLREIARCLKDTGVEMIDDMGVFDSQYQTVVDTRFAQTPEQIDKIAETFRPGYRFQNELLRPQEVILFTK